MTSGRKRCEVLHTRRAASKTMLCDWVVKAWKSLSSDLIIKSFRVCGQVSDGNIDEIQCLQEGKSLSECKQVLRDLLALAPSEIDCVNLKKKMKKRKTWLIHLQT